ncbi:hypothetical protein [Nocardiopsis halotolerans]|uniref:hypothetical protein n=1 Tax=Nocardiopsis halotolerans TaxID=124252 RepID=UPI00034A6C0F|nr:hypothetical protein [Nocardiopsis halotolerans]
MIVSHLSYEARRVAEPLAEVLSGSFPVRLCEVDLHMDALDAESGTVSATLYVNARKATDVRHVLDAARPFVVGHYVNGLGKVDGVSLARLNKVHPLLYSLSVRFSVEANVYRGRAVAGGASPLAVKAVAA